MKMFRYILLIFGSLLTLAAFNSCVGEKGPGNGGGDNNIKPGEDNGEAYISMKLSIDMSSLTRAVSEPGTTQERMVDKVYMLLYNKDSEELEYLLEFNVKNYSGSSLNNFHDADSGQPGVSTGNGVETPTQTSFVSVGKKVAVKDYKMLILVNPNPLTDYVSYTGSGDDIIPDGGQYLSSLQSAITVNGYDKFGIKDATTGSFFMSNANGVVSVTADQIRTTPILAETQPVRVKVDRLLAKVMLNEKATGVKLPEDVTLGTVQWRLYKVNKKTYLFRQYAQFSEENPAGSAIMETAANSTTTDRKYVYATDPNFTSHNITNDFNTDDYLPALTDWNDKNQTLENNYRYAFENTMSKAEQVADNWEEYTTQIEVQATLCYTALLEDVNNASDPGRNYYSIKNTLGNWKVFTHAQAVEWYAGGVESQQSFPADMDGLKNAIDADAAGQQVFDFTAASPSGEYRSSQGITYHKQGLNKYRFPVKHFKSGQDLRTTTYGHYGIVRNNIYKITLESIYGPGTPSESGDQLSVLIRVDPWYVHEQDEDDLDPDR